MVFALLTITYAGGPQTIVTNYTWTKTSVICEIQLVNNLLVLLGISSDISIYK